MGMGAKIHIVNTCLVQSVDADFAMGMNDVVVFHDDTYMCDSPFFIIKKGEVTWAAFFNKT